MGKNKHLMVSLIVIVVVSLDIWLKTIALGIVMPQQPNLTKDQPYLFEHKGRCWKRHLNYGYSQIRRYVKSLTRRIIMKKIRHMLKPQLD